MKLSRAAIASGLILFTSVSFAQAHQNYIGYSGAPGSRGSCSISCHERHNFTSTITVTGFPESYSPEQQYTINITRQGGSSISQFNASVRIGTSSVNAGTIAAGTNTSIYNHAQETNGVHWSSNSQSSGTFLWTAPESGTGDVRLYWAGLQGSLSNGSDTLIILTSHEGATGIGDNAQTPEKSSLEQNYPNPFNAETLIKFSISSPGVVEFEILDILGQRVYQMEQYIDRAGEVSLLWDGQTDAGNQAPSGVYFYRLKTGDFEATRKMTLLR